MENMMETVFLSSKISQLPWDQQTKHITFKKAVTSIPCQYVLLQLMQYQKKVTFNFERIFPNFMVHDVFVNTCWNCQTKECAQCICSVVI